MQANMPDTLPKFDHPPVVETVLSAQFGRLPKYRTAHAGVFREAYLGREWDTLEEQPRIDDLFERFGDERKWGPAGGGIRISTGLDSRTQIIGSDPTRMIQVQDSRFIFNWRKGEGLYPSYAATRQDFDVLYARFREFVKSQEWGELEENQWEVSYVNHLIKGEMWNSVSDCRDIFPWLVVPPTGFEADGASTNWNLVLPKERGRLHCRLYYGRIAIDGPEAIILDLTARGPASMQSGFSVANGFEIGHEAIVKSFTAMTSETAHAKWGRRR